MRTDVELIRILSCFGIVWFHSMVSGHDVAYSGLVVFLILTAYFAMVSSQPKKLSERLSRLLVPYLIWFIIFILFNIVRGEDAFTSDYNWISIALTSPAIHLWYLPFAFICLVSIDFIKKYISSETMGIFSVVMGCMLLLSSPIWREWKVNPPLSQYLHALPAIFFGVFFGSFSLSSSKIKNILITFMAISNAIVLTFGLQGISITYPIGILSSIILLRRKSLLPDNEFIIKFAKLNFGIYLVHPLALFLFQHIGIENYLLPIIAFMSSMIGVFICHKLLPQKIVKYIM